MAQLQYGSSGVVYSNIATLILQGWLSGVDIIESFHRQKEQAK